MKKAIIFHGTDCNPKDFWYGWVAETLRKRGYEVIVPAYPDINKEPIEVFLPKVQQAHAIDEETLLIGHSAGAPLILSLLEHGAKCMEAILVAGFSEPYSDVERDPILQEKYDWDKIKASCPEFVFINSVNDPWGCDDAQGRIMFDHLGGTLVIRNDGHFGSQAAKQEYASFPLLVRLVL